MRRLAAAASVLLVCGLARADEPPPATAALKGFRYVLKPGFTYQQPNKLSIPAVTQDVTFTVSNHLGWAFPIGPIVLSPGASVPVYFFDGNTNLPGATLAVLGEIEVHLPLRYVSVYGLVGAGGAFYFGSNQQGGVFRGGGGATLYPATWIGIGMQASYLKMTHAAANGPDDVIDAIEIVWPIEFRF